MRQTRSVWVSWVAEMVAEGEVAMEIGVRHSRRRILEPDRRNRRPALIFRYRTVVMIGGIPR